MWHALGANLDEKNAPRTAGSLESVELIYNTIHKDCMEEEKHVRREYPQQEDAVKQIVSDLQEGAVFKKSPGRKGYDSFPEFKRSLLDGLDYRDLNKWLK